MRKFDTGATRDDTDDKLDYEGFLSPLVLERYAQYMHKHRKQADDEMRDSDNWQKGIPLDTYMKSGWRHFLEVWKLHRRLLSMSTPALEDALCALLFNIMGYLHEVLKKKPGPGQFIFVNHPLLGDSFVNPPDGHVLTGDK